MHKLFLISSICIGINHLATAQTIEFPLRECARAFYKEDSTNTATREQKMKELRACVFGKKFPPFKATTTSGKTYSKADLQGKVVFVTSWFSNCGPCLAEMPMLNELNTKYKDEGFLLLSFSPENIDQVNAFLKKRPLNYEVFPSSEELIMYEMQTNYGYPTNIIVNKKGEIVEFKMGTPTDEAGLETAEKEFMEIIERELAR